MSDIFSSGSRRTSRADLNHIAGEGAGSLYHDGYVFPTRRRMRRAQQDVAPVNDGRQGAPGEEDIQPYLSRRARRDLNGRREYEDQLVRDYFKAEHGTEMVTRGCDAGQSTVAGGQRLSTVNASERNPPLQVQAPQVRQRETPELGATAGVTARAQEHVRELLQAQQRNVQALYAQQGRPAEQESPSRGREATQRGHPIIKDPWSLPNRRAPQAGDGFAGYLPGKQKVFVDPTASDNLAMVQPADYVHIPGRSGPVVKSSVTSSIPVITANQPAIPGSGQSLYDLGSSRSSLLARAEQIASNSSITGTANIDAAGGRVGQEHRQLTTMDQQRLTSAEAVSRSSSGHIPYSGYPQSSEDNPPLASGEARGLQPINTKTAGSKSRLERIATIAVTAGISIVFSVVIISIFFIK